MVLVLTVGSSLLWWSAALDASFSVIPTSTRVCPADSFSLVGSYTTVTVADEVPATAQR
jgi:hypothetical protein